MTGSTSWARTVAVLTVSSTVAVGVATVHAGTASATPAGPGCPALHVLGVQGTGQSSPNADPSADTGVVGALVGPVMAATPDLVQRTYIPYGSSFGGVVPGGGPEPYATSVADARRGLDDTAVQIADSCPKTKIAGVGYSQGAQAMSDFAHDIGAGNGPVEPERVAGIALYAHPDRAPGEATFPGRPGQLIADPPPGTTGAALATAPITNASPTGGGIADGATSYGSLTGRVADICAEGDLVCSAPHQAALLRIGAEIAAQADLREPMAAVASLHDLLSSALGESWSTVVLNDFDVRAGDLDYMPQQSLAQRLINAADPRTPAPTSAEHGEAASRWNDVIAAVAANPLGTLPKLAEQLWRAWSQVITDNADLIDPAVWGRYADTVRRHNDYASTGQLDSGTAWMIALAHDLAGSR